MARETAVLNAHAFHSPKKLPSLESLLASLSGEKPKGQDGDARRSLMKALAIKTGGKIARRR